MIGSYNGARIYMCVCGVCVLYIYIRFLGRPVWGLGCRVWVGGFFRFRSYLWRQC